MRKQQIEELLRVIAKTHRIELDCAEFLARMPALAELRSVHGAIPEALRLAEDHERLCPNCREECAALIEAIRSELRT